VCAFRDIADVETMIAAAQCRKRAVVIEDVMEAGGFDAIETSIRDQLRRMLPRSFDDARDIAGITVNRWSHGYAYDPSGLTTDASVSEETMALARRPLGRVAIANSDAGWSAYAQTAVDQAWRAVQERREASGPLLRRGHAFPPAAVGTGPWLPPAHPIPCEGQPASRLGIWSSSQSVRQAEPCVARNRALPFPRHRGCT